VIASSTTAEVPVFTKNLVVGLNADWDDNSQSFAAKTGFRSVRVGWEPNWSRPQLEDIITRAAAKGLIVDLEIVATKTAYGRYYSDPGVRDLIAWAVPKFQLGSISFFNEGNHQPFIQSPDPYQWADACVELLDLVKKLRPKLACATGGLSPEAGTLTPVVFLREGILHNHRLLEFDALGMHPYEFPYNPLDPNPWNFVHQLDELHRIVAYCRAAYQVRATETMPFWLTEFGAPSYGTQEDLARYPDAPFKYNEADQAKWALSYIEAFARSQALIGRVHWYCDRDGDPGTGASWESHVGLRRQDGTPKPAAAVMQAFAWGHRMKK
jgi:hypothetical protein